MSRPAMNDEDEDAVERELREAQGELDALLGDERTIPDGGFEGVTWGDFVRGSLLYFASDTLSSSEQNLYSQRIHGQIEAIGYHVKWFRRLASPGGHVRVMLQKTARARRLHSRCAQLRLLQPTPEDKRVRQLRRSTAKESLFFEIDHNLLCMILGRDELDLVDFVSFARASRGLRDLAWSTPSLCMILYHKTCDLVMADNKLQLVLAAEFLSGRLRFPRVFCRPLVDYLRKVRTGVDLADGAVWLSRIECTVAAQHGGAFDAVRVVAQAYEAAEEAWLQANDRFAEASNHFRSRQRSFALNDNVAASCLLVDAIAPVNRAGEVVNQTKEALLEALDLITNAIKEDDMLPLPVIRGVVCFGRKDNRLWLPSES